MRPYENNSQKHKQAPGSLMGVLVTGLPALDEGAAFVFLSNSGVGDAARSLAVLGLPPAPGQAHPALPHGDRTSVLLSSVVCLVHGGYSVNGC